MSHIFASAIVWALCDISGDCNSDDVLTLCHFRNGEKMKNGQSWFIWRCFALQQVGIVRCRHPSPTRPAQSGINYRVCFSLHSDGMVYFLLKSRDCSGSDVTNTEGLAVSSTDIDETIHACDTMEIEQVTSAESRISWPGNPDRKLRRAACILESGYTAL